MEEHHSGRKKQAGKKCITVILPIISVSFVAAFVFWLFDIDIFIFCRCVQLFFIMTACLHNPFSSNNGRKNIQAKQLSIFDRNERKVVVFYFTVIKHYTGYTKNKTAIQDLQQLTESLGELNSNQRDDKPNSVVRHLTKFNLSQNQFQYRYPNCCGSYYLKFILIHS